MKYKVSHKREIEKYHIHPLVKNKTEEFVMYLLVSTSQCPVEGWPEHPQEDGSDHGKHVRRFVASIFGMCIDLLGSFLDL